MLRRTLAAFGVVALLALGGCAAKEAGKAGSATAGGVLRGVVVDVAVRPLAGAEVQAVGTTRSVNATTASDGLFTFEGLDPGNYVLTVTKPFYIPQQTTADVRLDEEGPIVKVVLQPETGRLPFANQYKWDGFIECSASIGNWCGIANLYPCIVASQVGQPCPRISNDQSFVYLKEFFTDLQRVPDWLQTEAYWESTQSLSNTLGIRYAATNQSEWDQFMYGPVLINIVGPSPLVGWSPVAAGQERTPGVGYMANRTTLNESQIGVTRGLTTELFHGRLDAAPGELETLCTPDPPNPVINGCWSNSWLGAAASQRISIVYSAFYGYTPPAGWTFVESGKVPPPA